MMTMEKATLNMTRRFATTRASHRVASAVTGSNPRRALSTMMDRKKGFQPPTQPPIAHHQVSHAPRRLQPGKLVTEISTTRFFSADSEQQVASFSELQKAHWKSYLATGRGSIALFHSIDSDHDGLLNPDDIHAFLFHAMQDEPEHTISPKALRILDQRSHDHPLDLHEFKDWLVQSTQERGYVSVQTAYENSSYIGARAVQQKQKQQQQKQKQKQQKLPPKEGEEEQQQQVDQEYHPQYAWNKSTMSQGVRRMQYAVRGDVVMRADELAASKRIIYTNIGNPHSVGQPPISFYRQVLALCDLPAELGVDHPVATQMFPADVLERARELRAIVGPSGTGAYTNSQGLAGVRQHVAKFISERDGHEAFPGDIYLTNGASAGIELVLNCLISQDHDAIMIPIPQYPIYTALIARLGGRKIGYYLDEESGWGITREELEKRLEEAHKSGLHVKGLAMINPGNPTGQVLKREDVETIAKFCSENGIVLLSDEVYQRNVYAPDKEFVSAKKVAVETPGCEHLELVSFHSTSKGLIGECGRRGGYMELCNIDPFVQSQLYKLASSGLCSGVAGQIMTILMVHGPPKDGESYDHFVKEEDDIFQGLTRRSKALVDGLNAIDGIECQTAEGAMYAFPKLELPAQALQVAEDKDQTPDTLYALSLLEETGICVVPASGFGQKEGRVGFRTTFLPPDEELNEAIELFGRHHELFCNKYSALG